MPNRRQVDCSPPGFRGSGQKKSPAPCFQDAGPVPGDDLLSQDLSSHYHRRCGVSLPGSEWDRVVPPRCGHQRSILTCEDWDSGDFQLTNLIFVSLLFFFQLFRISAFQLLLLRFSAFQHFSFYFPAPWHPHGVSCVIGFLQDGWSSCRFCVSSGSIVPEPGQQSSRTDD
jgi:hypothetical protein